MSGHAQILISIESQLWLMTVATGWTHLSLQCSRIHLQSAFDLRSRRCEFKAGQDETNASLYYSLKMSVC